MKLPLRLSTAQELINEYSPVVDSYVYIDPKTQRSELLSKLYDLKDKTTKIASSMLRSLGYEGSLENMEKELNIQIKQLQKTTFYLNGEELNAFMIDELTKAIPADPAFQKKYEQFKEEVRSAFDLANDVSLETLARAVFDYLGHSIGDAEIVISNGAVRSATGRDIKGRFSLTFSEDFYKSSALVQEAITKKIRSNQTLKGKIKTKREKIKDGYRIDVSNDIDEDNLLNWLKNPKSVAKNLSPDSIDKINELMTQRILKNYKGADISLLKNCIEEILILNPYAFFVGNTAKDMTGILGEIQGLYYIKSLIKNSRSINWSEVEWVGGINNPHADLVLTNLLTGNRYGIQVKNTTIPGAKQEVFFENFSSDIVNHNAETGTFDFNWLKEQSNKWSDTIQQNPILFNAATQFLAMEQFNIPYRYLAGKAFRVSSNSEFELTRRIIENEAEKSRKALISFVTGMLCMQLAPSLKNEEASILYLVGGSLAITSASILTEIIDSIEKNIRNFEFTIASVDAHKNTEAIGTIVEFFNAGKHNHEDRTKYMLQSSYTFWKKT